MSEDKQESKINYVFYLKHKDKLEKTYYQLANILRQVNITLLPISLEDLKAMDKSKKNFVISLRGDYSSAMKFNEALKSSLDFGMASGRMVVYDLSSFSTIEKSAKYELKGMYQYFQLPVDLKSVAISLITNYFREKNMVQEWPGGRRAQLPRDYEIKN